LLNCAPLRCQGMEDEGTCTEDGLQPTESCWGEAEHGQDLGQVHTRVLHLPSNCLPPPSLSRLQRHTRRCYSQYQHIAGRSVGNAGEPTPYLSSFFQRHWPHTPPSFDSREHFCSLSSAMPSRTCQDCQESSVSTWQRFLLCTGEDAKASLRSSPHFQRREPPLLSCHSPSVLWLLNKDWKDILSPNYFPITASNQSNKFSQSLYLRNSTRGYCLLFFLTSAVSYILQFSGSLNVQRKD